MVLPAELIEDAWLRSPPGAEVTRIADAGHFVQEDAPFAGSL
jgi:pimeloyl-ACP methyl ester carboxylesterase